MFEISNPGRTTVASALEYCAAGNADLVALSIQTTGLDEQKDEILQIGAAKAKVGPDNFLKVTGTFNRYVKVTSVPKTITALTGISEDTVQNASSLFEVVADLQKFINGSVIIGYNVPFTMKFLGMATVKTGLSFKIKHFIDLYRICVEYNDGKDRNLTLVGMAESFHLAEQGQWHDALHDAKILVQLTNHIVPPWIEYIGKKKFGTEKPMLISASKDSMGIIHAYVQYYGEFLVDPKQYMMAHEYGALEKVDTGALEKQICRYFRANDLKDV